MPLYQILGIKICVKILPHTKAHRLFTRYLYENIPRILLYSANKDKNDATRSKYPAHLSWSLLLWKYECIYTVPAAVIMVILCNKTLCKILWNISGIMTKSSWISFILNSSKIFSFSQPIFQLLQKFQKHYLVFNVAAYIFTTSFYQIQLVVLINHGVFGDLLLLAWRNQTITLGSMVVAVTISGTNFNQLLQKYKKIELNIFMEQL